MEAVQHREGIDEDEYQGLKRRCCLECRRRPPICSCNVLSLGEFVPSPNMMVYRCTTHHPITQPIIVKQENETDGYTHIGLTLIETHENPQNNYFQYS